MKNAITLKQLKAGVGTEIGCSEWRVVSQDMIDKFAFQDLAARDSAPPLDDAGRLVEAVRA